MDTVNETNSTQAAEHRTFKTQVSFSTTNADRLSIKSPKTGEFIYIYQGWIPTIPKDLAQRIFDGWWAHERSANKEGLGRTAWMIKNPYMVDMTVDDLKALHKIYQQQTAELSKRNRR